MTSLTASTFSSPIPAAKKWLDGVTLPEDRPLINVSQAAPIAPPPPSMVEAMKAALDETATHVYGPDLGSPALRAALADNWSQTYGAPVTADQVAITSGANHAFATVIAALCGHGDEVLLPVPWYFNHKMWLDMAGMSTVPLPCDAALMPDLEAARARITPRTRSIVLVSPNNPTGVEYPAELLQAFYDLAKDHGIALILDETYRDFLSRPGAPHALLQNDGWDEVLIQIYSFSKSYRLTGHRVGAIVTAAHRMDAFETFIDTVTICPSQLGQRAALNGLQTMGNWVGEQRADILTRADVIRAQMPRIEAKGWRLLGLGAYFAYLEHPFAMDAETLAQTLARDWGILALPGTMFTPDGDASGARHLRVAFANIDASGITALFDRLEAAHWPLAPSGPAA